MKSKEFLQKVFLKISKNSHENAYSEIFYEICYLEAFNVIKIRLQP